MPTDTHDVDESVVVTDPDGIDTKCSANPLDADGPTDVWCGNDAVTFVFKPAGHRVYLCEDHAKQANRFGDDVFDDGPPSLAICKRCLKFTPRTRINHERICEECQT